MNILLLIVFSLITVAKSFQPGPLFDMGPLSIEIKKGSELKPKYLPLNEEDVQAAENILPFVTYALHSESITGGPIDPLVRDRVGPLPATSISGPTLLTNLTIHELKGLRIEDLEVRLENSKSSIRLDARVTAQKKIRGETFFITTVTFGFFRLPATGHLKIIVTGLQVTFAIRFELLDNSDSYNITGADVDIKAENIQIQLYLKNHHKIQNNKTILKRSFDKIKENVIETITDLILKYINEFLGKIPKENIWLLFDNDEIKNTTSNTKYMLLTTSLL